MVANKEVAKLENSSVKLTVTVSKADAAKEYGSLVESYAKKIQIPGFRKGKAPKSVLENKYGGALKADALSDIIEKALTEVFEQIDEKPLPYAQPVLSETPELDFTRDLVFSVSYDVFPEFSVARTDGAEIEVPQAEIADADIDKEINEIRERNAIVSDKTEAESACAGDIATVSYCELDENGEAVPGAERQDFVFTIGSGYNIYKFDDDIIGMKKGETKSIEKTYPADFENKDLAGKTVRVRVTLTALKVKKIPELDDELAQDVNEKFSSAQDLINDVKKNMQTALDNRLEEIKNNALMEWLIEKNPIELPRSMVNTELEGRWRMTARRFQTSEDDLLKMVAASGSSKEETLEKWIPDAEKALKSRLITERLIKDLGITVDAADIDAEIESIAAQSDAPLAEVKKQYDTPQMREYLEDDVKVRRLYARLLEKARVKKGKKLSFEEIFSPERQNQ